MNQAPQIPKHTRAFASSNVKAKKTAGKSSLRFLILVIVVIFLGFFATKLIFRSKKSNILGSSQSDKVTVKPAKKSSELNHEFTFPIKDDEGEEISRFVYTIEKAELTDELIIKGSKAAAVKGRIFLVLTIKIVNNLDVSIDINTRDFVRVAAIDSDDRLAADIHNDPVTIQPIATKFTRLAFPVDEGITNFKLYVGGIKADKEEIDLTL